jgi:hypothetical protein
LQRLPEVINSPVIIELASFGNLGDLVLSNKTFGPRGSIEIINRVYGKAEASFSAPLAGIANNTIDEISLGNPYYLASAIVSDPNLVAFVGGAVIPSIPHDFSSTSSFVLGNRIVSAVNDARLTNNTTVFSRRDTSVNNRLTAALASKNSLAPFSNLGSNYRTQFTPYETNTESWDSINLYDASCINELTNSEIVWRNNDGSPNQVINALAYGNKLNSVKIYNCDGPIYLRNFTVDGGGFNGLEYGFDIRNSSVFLENCSVARCTKAGVYGLNSRITILRSFVAYRNYGFNSAGVRSGGTWLQKIGTPPQNLSSTNYAAGIFVVGSELNFSSTFERDDIYFASAINTYYPIITIAGGRILPATSWLICLSRNDIGLKAVNSRVFGGKNEKFGFGTPYYSAQHIISELNSEAGMLIDSSELEHSGRLHFYGNLCGLHSKNSSLKIDNIVAKYNQKEACKLINSRLEYNKDLYRSGDLPSNFVHQSTFIENGNHIKLSNSVYEPAICSSMPTYYGRFVASGNFGITQNRSNQLGALPAFIVDSNSSMKLLHAAILSTDSDTDSGKGGYGAAFHVNNGSELVLKGSKDYCTKIVGPVSYAAQRRKSGLYANNNSNIKIQGPTLIARYAVDLHADNASKIEITPHRTESGKIDVSGFDLTNRLNHTSVELHSTRACIVADNGSFINMEDLGDYRRFWSNGAYGTAALLSGVDYVTTEGIDLSYQTYTSGGSLQFYPNPNDSTHYGPAFANPTEVGSLYTNIDFKQVNTYYNYLIEDAMGTPGSNQDFSAVTLGGMCVRALNGSKINVDNVHFPCGWWNPSGVIYDVSGPEAGACNRLFIWNIADLSQLDAKLISVSGLHPADAAYFGPSGVWGNVSSAPASTPDTSSVSILDYYGRSNNHPYSIASATNQGPFRLYFSVDPAINWALNANSSLSGYIPQVYSQGYQFSGNLIFPGNVSSFYTSILKRVGTTLNASGFYYASSIVESPFTVRAVLDDSAANTFANAKHNTVGKSGLAKVVSIYFPYTGVYGGDSAQSSVKQFGRGLRSVNTFDLEKDN